MISDDFIVCLLFQLIVLIVNLIGFSRIKEMSFFAIFLELAISVQTILSFGDFISFGIILVIMNITFPIYVLSRRVKRVAE